jgi:asparagine synthase (glutamine-hydrolysing)
MCGIFGIINTKEKIDEGRVIAARDILAHRGPDDAGIYFSPRHPELVSGPPYVALAHRRLSIIDLTSAAHQPMTTHDRYTIVFNGEIYNFRELIPRLTSHVSHLTSQSDTEVILNLYAEYGKDCLQYLRGMFAFAIWDEKEKTLFAARDRFGIKPFYFLHNENEFIFSSELKAIKHYKKILTLSMEGVDAFLRTGSVPAPLTIYNDVSSLLPGHLLEIDCHPEQPVPIYRDVISSSVSSRAESRDERRRISINNYWKFSDLFLGHPEPVEGSPTRSLRGEQLQNNLNSTMDSRLPAGKAGLHGNDRIDGTQSLRGTKRRGNLPYNDDAKQKIRTSLLDTIKAHMVSDVEVGAFLSGGIDSTAIVSLMRQAGQEKIKTVSVVFPGNKLDESKYARLAAKTYNTEHIEIPFYEKDLLDDFENIMASMDQPTIDGINTYFVSKAAKQAGLKVVLSGLGGDELFGGYPSFINIPKYQRIKNLPFAKSFMKVAAPLLKNKLPAKAIEYMKNPNSPNAEYKLIRGLFTDSELKSLGWSCRPEPVEVSSRVRHTELRVIPSGVEGRSAKDEGSVISAVRIPSGDERAGESEKSYSNHLQFNTEHPTFPLTDHRHPELVEGSSPVISTTEGRRNLKDFSVDDSFEMTTMQHISYLESCYYMRNQLLRDSDVFSMAHSLELRVPFVDHILYKSVLPYLDNGFDKNYPKKMLVDAVGDLPLELVNRPKMGFTFPFEDWMSRGQLKDLMIDSIKNLNSDLNIYNLSFIIENSHWSRVWALFILSRYV